MSAFRIGQGEDIHRLVAGRKLILCGVEIPYELGLLGHSDADCALHAVSDSILGALALGDIGKLFPDTSEDTKDMDSRLILSHCYGLAKERGYHLVNLDLSIAAEKPKLAPYILRMRESISEVIGCDVDRISVKAMTNEGLDAVGRGEAIRATCIVLLEK
ncbi:MAG: 2-C-methyl-D-erythritol 2,4-cyclodiphosphate synthase [Bacillota bacterium]|nr:2-C-methyl-D-erythritol 2,4-cyclodiphosphate synthase [Bacillota bacterium]